jgi:hypothetical protein
MLDPNSHALGYASRGLPNRPVARELHERTDGGIVVRWCDISPDSCAGKLIIGKSASSSYLFVGSANLTRRALHARNLEMSVFATRETTFQAWDDAHDFYQSLWSNSDGHTTVPYEVYEDTSYWRKWAYLALEHTGSLPY